MSEPAAMIAPSAGCAPHEADRPSRGCVVASRLAGEVRITWEVRVASGPGRVAIVISFEGVGEEARVEHTRAELHGLMPGAAPLMVLEWTGVGGVRQEGDLLNLDVPGAVACSVRMPGRTAGAVEERALRYARSPLLERFGVLGGCAEAPTVEVRCPE
ncbi:MAG: hypothetical protein ACT4PL_08245 [Phycisphaerales bacterium]